MIQILEPLDGTVFVCVAGKTPWARCKIQAPGAERVRVNGVEARAEGDVFFADVPVTRFDMRIQAVSGGEQTGIRIWRADIDRKIFRLSVDDNIRFLQDVAQKNYKSIFDNPYLGMYRALNREYGVCVHMNLYYESPEYGAFTLADMPGRYRAEWMENANWLNLSFHARADKPDKPYQRAAYGQVFEDCTQVMNQIRRFAGKTGEVTTLHWAEATPEGIRALYDCGVRVLLGDFVEDAQGNPAICYGATRAQFEAVRRNAFWRDPASGMFFCACDVVLNEGRMEDIQARLRAWQKRYPDRAFVDILIHEQYFYRDYSIYLPDYERRIRTGVEWCLRSGYKPGFIGEIITPQMTQACEKISASERGGEWN